MRSLIAVIGAGGQSGPAEVLVLLSPPRVSPPHAEKCLAEVIGDQEIDRPTSVESVTALALNYQIEMMNPHAADHWLGHRRD